MWQGAKALSTCAWAVWTQKRQRILRPPFSTGVCLKPEGPPRHPCAHESSMKPRMKHEEAAPWLTQA